MPYVVSLKYGLLGEKGDFRTPLTDLVEKEEVVVTTKRGSELGTVIAPPVEVPEVPATVVGDLQRRATDQDRQHLARSPEEQIQAELRHCRLKIREHNLPMKLVNVEHPAGGDKIIFYFIADGRVDFRELVKDLAHEYHTRIELKQIGVRDEARLLADHDHCGREICCRSWMRHLEPVTMKMAKAQKATLDPAKISGRCGRLMCCLRFEDSVYEELKKDLPRKGQQVVTAEGTSEVINYDILAQTLTVEQADGRRVKIKLSEVTKVLPREPKDNGSSRSANVKPRTPQSVPVAVPVAAPESTAPAPEVSAPVPQETATAPQAPVAAPAPEVAKEAQPEDDFAAGIDLDPEPKPPTDQGKPS